MSDAVETLKTNVQSVLNSLKDTETLSEKAAALHLALYIVTNKMGKEPDEVSLFIMMQSDLVGDTAARMIDAGVTV